MQIIPELQMALVTAFRLYHAKEGAKDGALEMEQRIVLLLYDQFALEMETFAKRLASGNYDYRELVQESWLRFISSKAFASFNPQRASERGYIAWYRTVYRNSMKDAHAKWMRDLSRHISLDGTWWKEKNERENWE